MDPAQVLQNVLSEIVPTLGSLALASLVILTSHAFVDEKKVIFQAFCFGVSLVISLSYLLTVAEKGVLQSFWSEFTKLDDLVKMAISVIVITTTYFGAAMYIAPHEPADDGSAGSKQRSSLNLTPASCDTAVSFKVPEDIPEDDKEFFEIFFDQLVVEITDDLRTVYEMKDEAITWVDTMIKYTVAGGKMNRGLALMAVQKTLANGRNLSDKERCQSAALGWCIEFLQAFFLVADDVMDDSVTRRGQPCWFRREEVKLISINDSFILESCVYKILKRYFGSENYYPQLVDLFIEVTRQTELGQLLDLTSQKPGGPIDLSRFTVERYTDIVKYKTAFYSFYLPIALGMIVSGVTNPKQYACAREILLIMGEYFQIQDDFLDCYGTPEQIGKIGTDIQDNKCSWLVVQALDRVNAKQRKVLEDNYGRHDPKMIEKIKKLYNELKLDEVFYSYEEDSYKRIQALLDDVEDMPRETFEFLLRKIYKRKK